MKYFQRITPPPGLFGKGYRYRDYLRQPRWQELSEALRECVGHCETCGATRGLEVHHMHYETLGREDPDDLLVLCAACHGRWHEIQRTGEGTLGDKTSRADVIISIGAGIVYYDRRRERRNQPLNRR